MYSYAVPLSEDQGTRSAPCQKPGELTACRLSAAPWLFYQISRNLSIYAGIKDPPRAAARGGFCIERGLLNVVVDNGGGLVELLGVGQQALEVLERGGVIEAVADALVGVDAAADALVGIHDAGTAAQAARRLRPDLLGGEGHALVSLIPHAVIRML